jgi:hypothetical protein
MLTKLVLNPNVVKVEAAGGEEGKAGKGEVGGIAAGKRLICNSQKNFA